MKKPAAPRPAAAASAPPIDRLLRSNLKLKHLQLLVALDQFRHLGRASEHLSLTQPAVSKTLAEVERLFGVPLFTRSTRGTEPTLFGLTVVRFARSVQADLDRTRDELAAVASGAAGRVRLGAMVVATPVLLTGALQALKQRSAQTTVLVEEGDLTSLLPRLRLGELDLFVGRLEPGYAAPDLETEALFDEPMCIVCGPDHPLARRRRLGWADVASLPWVMPPPWASSRIKLHQQFYRHGLNPPVDVVESSSFLVTLTGLRDRGALGFWAGSVARHFQAQGWVKVLPLPVDIELPPVGLITLRGRIRTPAAEQMMQCLREIGRFGSAHMHSNAAPASRQQKRVPEASVSKHSGP